MGYVYDSRGRKVREIDADGKITLYEYDIVNNLIGISDRNRNRTSFKYDDLDRQVQMTDARNEIMRYEYDKVGNNTADIDRLGRRTEYEYDNRNRLVKETDAINTQIADPLQRKSTRYTYDDFGNMLTSTDELDRTTTNSYDALNRLKQVEDPLLHSTFYSYDSEDNLTEVTDQLRRTIKYDYDLLNRPTVTTDANQNQSITTYDAVGNVTSFTDELKRTTRFTYDGRNWQRSVTDPLNHTTTTEYDKVGNILTVKDPLNHITRYTYDSLYRQISVTDPTNHTTEYTYDPEGNLLSLKDPENNSTTFTYDELNRLQTETNQLNATRTLIYDPEGNIISIIDRNNRQRQFTYDNLNRQKTEEWLDINNISIRTINYTYDAADQLKAVSDLDSSYTYDYDPAGRTSFVDNTGTVGVPNVILNYGYDDVNNRTSVTDTINGLLAGTEIFTYDNLNRMTQVTQSGNGVVNKRVNMSYDAASQLKQIDRFSDLNGTLPVVQTRMNYDLAGRTEELTHLRNNNNLAGYNYTYDDSNRITQIVSLIDGTNDYNYDERDQITDATYSYQNPENYSYDKNGNRTNIGYSTQPNNRLASDGTYNYEYDPEGNLTKKTEILTGEVIEFTWDYRNRLTKVVTKNNLGAVIESVDYTYDVFDRRIAKSVDSDGAGIAPPTVTRFVYDGDEIALVFDELGNISDRYLHGPQIDQVLAQEKPNGEILWALSDHQGTVRDLVDNTGTLLNHLTYDSFGNITSQTNPLVNFRFTYTGREFDAETGLYYYRARYFDPNTGRFVSEDPIGFKGKDLNLYRYVENNPIIFTDPFGEIKVFRPMQEDGNMPKWGFTARSLGVRLPNNIGRTIPGSNRPDVDIELRPKNPCFVVQRKLWVLHNEKGMSVAPNSPFFLISHRLPKGLGGEGKDPLWSIKTEELAGGLIEFHKDKKTHGVIRPVVDMPLDRYLIALYLTRPLWVKEDLEFWETQPRPRL